MLRPTAISVSPERDYMLKVMFDNGKTGIFDVKPYIQGEWYGQLADEVYFRGVKTDGFTVVWPNGQDLCPDELHTMSVSA